MNNYTNKTNNEINLSFDSIINNITSNSEKIINANNKSIIINENNSMNSINDSNNDVEKLKKKLKI